MLNSKALTDLLSHNRDDRLCKRWYIMTPNGTLLAYSQPTDIVDLRKQAAIAAITWQQHQNRNQQSSGPDADSDFRENESNGPVHALTIESTTSNIIMRVIQSQLLLVLEGGVPPHRPAVETRVTAENADGTPQRQREDDEAISIQSGHTGGSRVAASLLKLQRTKLDQLADIIRTELEESGFSMPEERLTTVF